MTQTDHTHFIQQEKINTNQTLGKLKADARMYFEVNGFPERKTEAYKYTPVKRILEKNFPETFQTSNTWTQEEIKACFYSEEEANHLVFINGEYAPECSLVRSSDRELIIEVLNEDSVEEISEIREHLGSLATNDRDPFVSLNTAEFSQGLFLKANKDQDTTAVFIYHFIDGSTQTAVHPRVLILAATGSRARVYEKTFRKGTSKIFSNALVEAIVHENAEIRWSKLQQNTENDFAIDGFFARQFNHSRLFTNTISFKGALIRNNLQVAQEGENCETHMHGLYQIGGQSHVDNNTAVDHRQPNSFSNELYKGIVDDQAKAVFNGKIYVRPQAQKTNAFQSNNNILLSDMATVNTKPQLEIWADDVKCSHGCTTGQLDEEAIFYLRSRGISKSKAKSLLLNAFASEALKEIKSEPFRHEIEEVILNKLGS